MSLQKLKNLYPFPVEKPELARLDHGWFNAASELGQFLDVKSKVVVEVGSWVGASATWFAKRSPEATIICIDHWRGSLEHVKHREWSRMLPTLYEQFLVNMWPHRSRVVPLRRSGCDGMKLLAELGIKPDLVYIDAAHDETSVTNDVVTAIRCFPDAKITGDDWQHGPVRAGVQKALVETGFPAKIKARKRTWWLNK